jgi:hypothetical protein
MEDGGAVHKNVYVLRFDSSVTVLRCKRVVGFAWIWIGIWFVNMWSWTRNHHSFHHLSSSSRKLSCFAYHWIFNGFAWTFPLLLILQWESLFECWYGLVVVNMVFLWLFYACCRAYFILLLILDIFVISANYLHWIAIIGLSHIWNWIIRALLNSCIGHVLWYLDFIEPF